MGVNGRTVPFSQTIPVMVQTDVLVVGAGPAGVCAALAAAKQGVRVMVIEKLGFSGGMATAAYVGPILGLYHWASGKRIMGGIGLHLLTAMEEAGGALLATEGMLVPFDPEVMKLICDRMLVKAGVSVRYHTSAVAVMRSGQRLTHVVVSTGRGLAAIEAQVCIDCSGDGFVAFCMGVPFVTGNGADGKTMPMTTVFRLGNVETTDIRDSENPDVGYVATDIRTKLFDAYQRGDIPAFGGPWVMRGSTLREHQAFVNMVRQWGDATDPESITRCEIGGRRDMFALMEYLKAHEPALSKAFIIDSGAVIGVRDSRHFSCHTRLSLTDCINRVHQPDSIGLGGHIIDIHATDGSAEQRRDPLPYYEIPLRALLPVGVPNLILAGRSIDADYAMFASARVMGTCMVMGQGAGTAAAWAVVHGSDVEHIDHQWMADVLESDGVPRRADAG